jgi:hypothetical protein
MMGGLAFPARAQAPNPTGPARGGAAEATGVPGITAREIRVGMSAAFKGTAAGLGTEFFRGAQAYYDEVNSRGGVNSRMVTVVALDDGYEPTPCIRNTLHLVERENVFFLSNYVGTPTLTRALPVIKRYAAQNVILVGNFTGAQPQRETPYVEHVFNSGPLTDRRWALVDRFGIGRGSASSTGRCLRPRRHRRSGPRSRSGRRTPRPPTRGAPVRGRQAGRPELRRAGIDAVLCTKPTSCGAFVHRRDLCWTVPISNVSFVGSDAMLRLLVQHGKTTGGDYTRALVNSQVVPSYDDVALPGVVEYRTLMDRHNPTLPTALRTASLRSCSPSLVPKSKRWG